MRERGTGIGGECEPEPAVEGRGESEGHDAEHAVDLGLSGECDVRAVGRARGTEVDEDDGGGPVEAREVEVPEIDGVEGEREEKTVYGDGAARGVSTDKRCDALAVAGGSGTFVAEVGGGGQDLEDLAAEADEEEQSNDKRGKRRVEL